MNTKNRFWRRALLLLTLVLIVIPFASVQAEPPADKGRPVDKGTPPGLEAKGGMPPGQVGKLAEELTAGNNLSFPVVWVDGATKVLPGTEFKSTLEGTYVTLDGVNWYLQKDPNNVWQAENNPAPDGVYNIDEIDWGDNLEARSWPDNSQVRVETVLYQNTRLGGTMKGFEMMHLGGQGTAEVWGTNGVQFDSGEATVYTDQVRLTIQKIDPTSTDLTWDGTKWVGTGVLGTYFSGAVHEGGDGPAFYTAEINVQGKVIFGYNWQVGNIGDGPGLYRLTFSIEDGSDVAFDTATIIREPVEEELAEFVIAAEPDMGGGETAIVADENLTYIDVTITDAQGAGGGSGGGGGQPGGPGNGGGGGQGPQR